MSRFFSLIQGHIHPSTKKKVIPAQEFTTLLEAAQILEKARQDAEELRQKAEAECVSLKETA